MSNSEYLKRYAAPRSWNIDRKIRTFISKPNPGAHPLERALPLGFIMKELGLAHTAREVKKILLAKHILVDGRRVLDPRFPVGLFDTIQIPDLKQAHRVHIDMKGRLIFTAEKETAHKACRIVGKTMLPGKKIQVNLIDGRNILYDKACAVGDTLVIEVPSQKVVKHLKLENGATILITSGRYVGRTTKVTNVAGTTVSFVINEQPTQTEKQHTYVI